jgi:nicotinate-nucleotide--dimethylbenzimidazole phosphoribosyltransferase
MLPSFRLIAAAFLCGFVMVYVGLRAVVSLHTIHEALPVTAAHAGTFPAAGARDLPGASQAAPVRFDLRFVTSPPATAPAPVNLAPLAIEQAPPPFLAIEEISGGVEPAPPDSENEHTKITALPAATPPIEPQPAAEEELVPATAPEPAVTAAVEPHPVEPEVLATTAAKPEPLESQFSATAGTEPDAAPAETAAVAARLPDSNSLLPPSTPAKTEASEPAEPPTPAAALTEPTATVPADAVGADPDPIEPAATAIETPRRKSAASAPKAKTPARTKRAPRTAAQNSFGAPFGGSSFGNWPKQQ